MDRLWQRVAEGRHTAVVGGLPPEPGGISLVRVACDGPERPLGPILEARARAEALLGEDGAPDLVDRVRAGLRRRLLGDDEPDAPGDVVAVLNRLARVSQQSVALVFDAVELADASTVELLREIVARKGWLALPLVLAMRTRPTGRAAELLRALVVAEGPAAVVDVDEDVPVPSADPGSVSELPGDVRLALRAAAHVGALFEARLVASLLNVGEQAVLERLQVAADAGVPLEDRGDGRLRMPEATAEALRSSTLASLSRRWHQALAGLVAPAEAATPDDRGCHARAARHLVAAGDYDGAATRFLGAASEARRVGAPAEALGFARIAHSLAVQLPTTEARRTLRVRILAETARLQWESHGPGADFTLAGALQTVDQAAALLRDEDPPALRADLAALTAAICYDIGDAGHLERAMVELTRTGRELQAAGDSLGAARLLTEQAAVLARVGEAERAVDALARSRQVFVAQADDDPDALLDLGETDHLLARMALHRQTDWQSALDYGWSAEQSYRKLGRSREQARVWETLGRLELRAGNTDAAADLLTRAVEAQQRSGDVVGLARSSAALADVLATKDRHYEALAVLGESVELNLEKGSIQGLAFNRGALEALRGRLTPQQALELSYELRRVEQRLTTAEATLAGGQDVGVTSGT